MSQSSLFHFLWAPCCSFFRTSLLTRTEKRLWSANKARSNGWTFVNWNTANRIRKTLSLDCCKQLGLCRLYWCVRGPQLTCVLLCSPCKVDRSSTRCSNVHVPNWWWFVGKFKYHSKVSSSLKRLPCPVFDLISFIARCLWWWQVVVSTSTLLTKLLFLSRIPE